MTKRQTLILDGADLAYYIKSLHQTTTADSSSNDHDLPNLAPRSPRKLNRIGAITFVTAKLDKGIDIWNDSTVLEKGTQVIGIEAASADTNNDLSSQRIISICDDLHMYQDSIAIIPSKVSPSDAISTAATSLLGVHCSSSVSSLQNQQQNAKPKKIVIVGGGDYAQFLTKALIGLGNQVSLVSARPNWSLPSPADMTSSKKVMKNKQELVEVLPPAVGPMALGFTMAIGEFDTLIDTLSDELGLGRALSILDNDIVIKGGRFLERLQELHGCSNYLSTLTRSQQYVLNKGLMFSRNPVIRYQKEVEKLSTSKYQVLPPPLVFGGTLQVLLDQGIVYSSDQNENGPHETKSNFVRGWSLSDMTELKTWPREGAGRFGFPVADLPVSSVPRQYSGVKLELENSSSIKETLSIEVEDNKEATISNQSTHHDRVEEDSITTENLMVATPKLTANATIKVTKRPSKESADINNPHVTTIQSVSDLNKQIIESKRNCILFLTASYCQKCKQITPKFNRIARISSESSMQQQQHPNNKVLFATVDISNGPRGKQLGKLLGADKVPSVIVFRKGNRLKAGNGDNETSSTVVERNNLRGLENVVSVLLSGERIVDLNALLSTSSEAVKN